MGSSASDKLFAGSIPQIYEQYLVPLIFEYYAEDLASRLRTRSIGRVLEIAAGTGVVTRQLAATLAGGVSILATDLNQTMLDHAAAIGTSRPVTWRQADAMQLQYDAAEFDAVVCQFGVMFFPDRVKAYGEARRVLKPGGVFLFNVWDRIEENEFAHIVTFSLESVFPDDPPRFMARTPHGYHDRSVIQHEIAAAGFKSPRIDTIATVSRAPSPREPAVAFCQGTPLRNEIEARDASQLGHATDVAAEAIARRFGRGAVSGKIQAHVVTVEN
jgi:ubiquinone/menaquinone biosynthesis C-methylase UbiE